MNRIVCDLDPFSAEFRQDPYSAYARMRALGPVVWLERYGIWGVSHYDAVKACLNDYSVFSNAGGGGMVNYFTTPPWRKPSIILEVDPPEHERTRSVLIRVFSRQALSGLLPSFKAEAERLIDGVLSRGTVDGVTDLVQPFPLTVFGDAIGMALAGDRQMMLRYGAMVFGGFGPPTDWYQDLMQGAQEVSDWIWDRCARENLAPHGFGSAIYAFADSGEIEEEEARLLVRSLLSAGVDTTIDSIGLALWRLAEHPEQWEILKADPGLARNAFEEATRFDSSSQSLFRTTLRETEFYGAQMGKHDKVMVFLGSAGRDPSVWEASDRFDIRRKLQGQIGYGAGIHGCVAQMVARLEGEAFFRALSERASTLEMTGPAQLRLNPGLRGLSSLPLSIS